MWSLFHFSLQKIYNTFSLDIHLLYSYKCDDFVINVTKTGDIQLVRDTLEAAAEWLVFFDIFYL